MPKCNRSKIRTNRYVIFSISVLAAVLLSACGGGKVDGEARQKKIQTLYDKAIKDGRYTEAMCLKWGDGPFSPQPGKYCQCQVRVENAAFPKRKGERDSFFKRVLESYDRIEGTPRDRGFDPHMRSVFQQMQFRIENLPQLANPSAFDETINQKIEKQCGRYINN